MCVCQLSPFVTYPDDGWLDIDNNEGENSLRGLCLGWRNWLFCGSDRGGRAAAIHFSLLASCKRHGHDPWVYLRDVLTRLPAMLPAASEEDLLPLLPHRENRASRLNSTFLFMRAANIFRWSSFVAWGR